MPAQDLRQRLWPARLRAGFACALLFLLGLTNGRLYGGSSPSRADAQLRFLAGALDRGAAERMQGLFPEGYVFTWALFGAAAAQVAGTLPASDPRRDELLHEASGAIAHVLSPQGRAVFERQLSPSYGAFYTGWSLYLRSVVLRAGGADAVFDRALFESDCDRFTAALAASKTPFLPSYSGQAWPADTVAGMAGLAIRDRLLGPGHEATIARWLGDVRQRLDPATGAIPHAASFVDGTPEGGARGESLALMSLLLAEVDPVVSRQQYELLRKHFVAVAWGLPGVREYPRGSDGPPDIDSGPLVFGLGGPATTVAIGAARAHGDEQLAATLLDIGELVGMPFELWGSRRYVAGLLPVGDAFLVWARSAPLLPAQQPWAPLIPWWWRVPLHVLSLALAALIGWRGGLWPARRAATAHTGTMPATPEGP